MFPSLEYSNSACISYFTFRWQSFIEAERPTYELKPPYWHRQIYESLTDILGIVCHKPYPCCKYYHNVVGIGFSKWEGSQVELGATGCYAVPYHYFRYIHHV